MGSNYCSKLKKVTGVVFIVLFFVQMLSFLPINNTTEILPEETGNLTPNNPGPNIYRMAYNIVENDIMYSCKLYRYPTLIDIVNVSDPRRFQKYNSYNIHQGDYTIDPRIVAYQLFDDKLFIVVQHRNEWNGDSMDIGLEIVNVNDPLHPFMLSSYIFNDTRYAGDLYNIELYYRMFFKDNLLYLSLIDDADAPDHSIRVINCTDIYHPNEIARKKYLFNDFFNFYFYDNIIYTLTTVSSERRITAYNYSDVTNISLIFYHDWTVNDPYRFIGVIDDCLFVEVLFTNDFLSYSIDPTTYDLTYVGLKDWSEEYIQSRISNDHIFSLTTEAFYINDVSNIQLIKLLSNYRPKIKNVKYFSFERFVIDDTKVYISCRTSNNALVLFILDISKPKNIILLLPDASVFVPIPFMSILFAISLVAILSRYKKRKK